MSSDRRAQSDNAGDGFHNTPTPTLSPRPEFRGSSPSADLPDGSSELLRTIKVVQGLKPTIAVSRSGQASRDSNEYSAPVELENGHFGRFEILRELGVGGNGIVFQAFDPALRRQVALKLPRLDASFDVLVEQRFIKEAQAAALLHHPHIVPVFEVGHVGAVRYIVSAYCSGPNLAKWLDMPDRKPISARTVASWVAGLARAAHYAHTKGIIHRDIKPSNVLLEPIFKHDDAILSKENSDDPRFNPQLTDFGIAKWLGDDSLDTQTGIVLGTLGYMAPEQAHGQRDSIGPATDIYGLGIVLYELLTGRGPFETENNPQVVLRQIRNQDPVPPSRLVPGLSPDLDAICLKCLEKKPEDRYASAEKLAEDLECFRKNRPITARSIGVVGRSIKLVQRHPAQSLGAVAMAVVLLLNAAAGWWYSTVLQSSLDDTRSAKEHATILNQQLMRRVYPADVRRAQQALELGNRSRAKSLLANYQPGATSVDRREFTWYYLWAMSRQELRTLNPGHGEVYQAGLTPDQQTLYTAGEDGVIRFWNANDLTLKRTFSGHQSCVNSVALTADGTRMVSGSCDRTLCLWDLRTGKVIRQYNAGCSKTACVMLTPDEQFIVSGDFENSWLRLWDIGTGQCVSKFGMPHELKNVGIVGFLDRYRELDRPALVSSGADGLRVHALDQLETPVARFAEQDFSHATIKAAALSPDATQIAYAASPLNPRVGYGLEIETMRLDEDGGDRTPRILGGDRTPVFSLKYSPDSQMLASGTDGGVITVWDTATGEQLYRFVGHTERVSFLEFTSDGGQLISSSTDGTVKWWPLQGDLAHRRLPVSVALDSTTPSLCFSADASRLMLVGRNEIEAWNVADWSRDSIGIVPDWSYPNSLMAVPDPHERSSCRVSVLYGAEASVWDPETKDVVGSARTNAGSQITLSSNGRWLAVTGSDEVYLWNTESPGRPRLFPRLEAPRTTAAVALGPDGSRLAATTGGGTQILLWDLNNERRHVSGRGPWVLSGHELGIQRLVFSVDGTSLGSVSLDGTARVWNVRSGRERATFVNHNGPVRAFAFAPHGSLVASGSDDGTTRLWDSETGTELLEFDHPGLCVIDLVFSPDETVLAGLCRDEGGRGVILIWCAPRP